jgi:hypothetical protein
VPVSDVSFSASDHWFAPIFIPIFSRAFLQSSGIGTASLRQRSIRSFSLSASSFKVLFCINSVFNSAALERISAIMFVPGYISFVFFTEREHL